MKTAALPLRLPPRESPLQRGGFVASRILTYGALIFWAFVCLFPIYWTVSTSFKTAPDVMQGALLPWVDFAPDWKGWRSLGLSPDTIGRTSTVRDEFLKRFANSVVSSVSASFLAVWIGSLAAYGLSRFSYRFGPWRNKDIAFFFLSQLILPPVVLAMPFLVLYKELALLDTRIGLILLYTLMVLPIVIWVMRDQFSAIPIELEEAALVDGLSVWGAFLRIVLPLALPGHGGGVHPLAGAVLERVFLRRPAHQHGRQDPAGHGGEPDRLAGHQLVVHGGAVDGGDRAAGARGHLPRALHHQGHDRRRRAMTAEDSRWETHAEEHRSAAQCGCALRAARDGAWRRPDPVRCELSGRTRWRARRCSAGCSGSTASMPPARHARSSRVFPLDTFVDHAVLRMEVVGKPDEVPPVQAEVQREIDADRRQAVAHGLDRTLCLLRAGQTGVLRDSDR